MKNGRTYSRITSRQIGSIAAEMINHFVKQLSLLLYLTNAISGTRSPP